ncbi:hypothetical protein [Novipirellula rosea]|uniref:Uncharacterized protein n=1 Tax=Novipirellula rosea TaxID=1031540 RepID=A0ABP8NLP9_9BACT
MLLISTTRADDSTQQNKSQSKAAEQWIEQLSSKVDLTSDQKDKIREQLNANGQKVASTWSKFAEANAKAIALEATMYAAIEDGMSDQQKQQFRENRKNKQQTKKSQNKQDSGKTAKQKKNGQSDNSGRRSDNRQASASSDPSNKEKSGSSGQNSTSDRQANQDDSAYVYVTEMIIVPAQELASDVQMDAQQRQQCEQACQQFHSRLHQAYSDIQRYHDQLVQLEAEKMLAVEKVLNEEQLQKLKEERSSGQSG